MITQELYKYYSIFQQVIYNEPLSTTHFSNTQNIISEIQCNTKYPLKRHRIFAPKKTMAKSPKGDLINDFFRGGEMLVTYIRRRVLHTFK